MDFHNKTVQDALKELQSNINLGLDNYRVENSVKKHGKNVINKAKSKNFFMRLFDAFKEPMLIIYFLDLRLLLAQN